MSLHDVLWGQKEFGYTTRWLPKQFRLYWSHEKSWKSHDLGTLGRKVLWNYLHYGYVNAHNLLGPLVTVDWTTNVKSTPPCIESLTSFLPWLLWSCLKSHTVNTKNWGRKEIRKVTRDFAISVSLTRLWIKSIKRNSSFATLPMHRIIFYLHLGGSWCFP